MTVPVLHSFKLSYPQVRISVLTKSAFAGLFGQLGIDIIIADTKGIHKGLAGLFRLYREISKDHTFDAIADLHKVLRSRVLCLLFRFSGIQQASLSKERKQLAKLTRKENKTLLPLPSRFELYKEVFTELGFNFLLDPGFAFSFPSTLSEEVTKITGSKTKTWIGIAPFAAFQPKIYPPDKMKGVVRLLMQDSTNKILFFGGGKNEIEILEHWQKEFNGSINISGKLSLDNELELMSKLNIMIAMDSANMHFASLTGVPVLSVWGATHPLAGFIPWQQPESNRVQVDLYCRPCSVYGNVPCYRGDNACMNTISGEIIVKKAYEMIHSKELL